MSKKWKVIGTINGDDPIATFSDKEFKTIQKLQKMKPVDKETFLKEKVKLEANTVKNK
jgi:hypothetical protein